MISFDVSALIMILLSLIRLAILVEVPETRAERPEDSRPNAILHCFDMAHATSCLSLTYHHPHNGILTAEYQVKELEILQTKCLEFRIFECKAPHQTQDAPLDHPKPHHGEYSLDFGLPSGCNLHRFINHLIKRQTLVGVVTDRDYYDVTAAPAGPLPPRNPGDAPWTQAESSYRNMIACPLGIHHSQRGIVLLVPGTAGNASEVYKSSAYYQLLPSEGFDICWVDTPNYSISDMQLSAEFVAYAIKSLAPQSIKSGGKINIVSYSQGGPNVQWASTFWPSIHNLVRGHISLSPSMRGTASNILLCPGSNLAGGCLPSILQQSMGSTYMNAANSQKDNRSAAYALIPSTIIYTTSDEIVTPQWGELASSRLIGASNIALQQICPLSFNVDHFAMPGEVGAYGIALDALLTGRPAQASTIDRSYCTKTASSLGFQVGNSENNLRFAFRTAVGDQRDQMIASQFQTLRVPAEPPLQQYVCDRGYASSGCTRRRFRDKPTKSVLPAIP
ncbi:hypothetical protein KEM48_009695 [Puccinia striiformis f. sp. tritici PST-130]|uniref:Alpha/beta-hydrolase n=1 Tax=Puccinia striiformis f. sp. tritici PST-78 TaxID=1165861 RepID=A0A0L0VTK6_9BASI|nr:hypothetical protein KEM48_009695 [Puccinia striiformis f. sp. tritici PST-130]KNF02601.1 hypothetical protein PSTG_04200 [Puccinia striiformis f. sp. tritici PST-78]